MSAINKITKFILALYGIQAKEKKSLKTKVSGFVTRIHTNSIDDVARAGRRVESFISGSFSFTENAQPLAPGVIQDLRDCIELYIVEICKIISDGDGLEKAVEIYSRTATFVEEWNNRVNELDEQFLGIYGDIFSQHILLSMEIFLDTISVLKLCKQVPKPLRFLREETIGDAINSSMRMMSTLQKLKNNANIANPY